jgi:hypothetical protein
MPAPTLARFKGFHAVRNQGDDDLADAFIERRLEVRLSGALHTFGIRSKRSPARTMITSRWHFRRSHVQYSTVKLFYQT